MKRKSILLQTSAALLAALLAVSTCACGTEKSASDTEENAAGTEENDAGTEENVADTAEPAEKDDTHVISDISDQAEKTEAGETNKNPITVTFQESRDECKADDGTVILISDVQVPVVNIDGAADIAEKINADIAAYYSTFSDDDTLSMAKEDYAASLGEDGWDFHSYSTGISAKVTRMDDAVLSFELTYSAYTGGAHGNYGSVGRNYDVKTGALLAFDDISEDHEAFHAAVLDYMINLADTPAYRDKLFGPPSKADLDSALFRPESWLFTTSGISLLSDPYLLGPYSSGTIYFMLPYEKAYDLGLKEDYRYTGAFTEERYYTSVYAPGSFEVQIDGTPDTYYDLNGDGTQEGLALYGYTYDSEDDPEQMAYYIDGTDWGSTVREQLPASGYLEQTYALYDRDPADGITEIAVLYTELNDEPGAAERDGRPYTYLFRYTADKKLEFAERLDGYVTLPVGP